MLTSTNLQKNLFKLFAIAGSSGVALQVRSGTKVYLVSIMPTGETYTQRTQREAMKKARRRKPITLRFDNCGICAGLKVDKTCVNKHCPSNKNGV